MGCQQACALQPSHHTLRALKDRLVRDQGRSPPHKVPPFARSTSTSRSCGASW